MMVKSLLQGKLFGHPVHPALAHFPIGLFLLSLLLDLLGALSNDPLLVRAANYAMASGLGMALIAAIPGLVDYIDIRQDHPAKKVGTLHLVLNLVAVVLFVINLWLRSQMAEGEITPALPLLLSVVGVGIILYSGYLGGGMVYNDGIAVGRHRREAETPDKTIRVKADRSDGYAVVGPLETLKDGSSLRAEINGHVMAIVRMKDQVYAFQEFCTHRFGPLSEGSIHGENVECPWHGSCFDMRTGKVTQGPAKVDLKTYEVKIDNGQIMVRIPSG
jgi:nitrite reductase/ring-hydroxylating ferredoxin subunit/uncharacterized membrane protein